jgi:hypothetical protein
MQRWFRDGLLRFHRGLFRMPWPWQLWVLLLVIVNAGVPLFFLGRPEARLALITLMAAALIMSTVTRYAGFTRLLGLGHFVWFPLLAYLWTRLGDIPAQGFYGLWLRVLMAVNAISLVIDVTDVARYLAGERGEVVEGL